MCGTVCVGEGCGELIGGVFLFCFVLFLFCFGGGLGLMEYVW